MNDPAPPRTPPPCRRCGRCCLADYIAYVHDEDLERWRREKRQDILEAIEKGRILWAGDHLISSADGHYIHGCTFLSFPDGQATCTIYETRPRVCRDFKPGSAEICPLCLTGTS